MALESKGVLDAVDWQILEALQEDARLSYSALGRRVGLTQPAAADRVRRLEEAGVITGYRAELDLARLGIGLLALMRFSTWDNRQTRAATLALIRELPEVLECHLVTGSDSYVLKVAVGSVAHLEALLGRLGRNGQTTTSLVLSSPVTHRVIRAPSAAPATEAGTDPRRRRGPRSPRSARAPRGDAPRAAL